MTEPTTPLMRQYHAIKKQHPQTLVLFRLGDFYELFYEDAIVASRELQITLTSRNRERGQRVPMCGVPYHAAETYIARLIRAGYKVAICDQMEEASKGKKLVRREVVRVITPGTATEAHVLEPRENNFLAALARDPAGQTVGLACVDVSTGEFRSTEFSGPDAPAKLRDELEVMRPREILLPRPETLFAAVVPAELNGAGGIETRLDEWVFRADYAERILSEQFGVVTLEGFGLAGHPFALTAAGALVHYLRETSARGGTGLQHLDRIRFYEQQDALVLDNVSVRNLELIAPLFADSAVPKLRDDAAPTLLSRSTKPPPAWARDCCARGCCAPR
jgi:DNA mismatch repair protein MutS